MMKQVNDFEQHCETPFNAKLLLLPPRKTEDGGWYMMDQVKNPKDELRIIRDYPGFREGHIEFYANAIAMMFELNTTGKKVLHYFLDKAVEQKDGSVTVTFSAEECKDACKYSSKKMVYTGIAELLSRELIARSEDPGTYFCFPMVFPMKKTVIIGNKRSLLNDPA